VNSDILPHFRIVSSAVHLEESKEGKEFNILSFQADSVRQESVRKWDRKLSQSFRV